MVNKWTEILSGKVTMIILQEKFNIFADFCNIIRLSTKILEPSWSNSDKLMYWIV
jgi:hypothetical protein